MKNIIEVSFVNKLTYLTCADAVLNDWGVSRVFSTKLSHQRLTGTDFFLFFRLFFKYIYIDTMFSFFYFRTFGSVLCVTARLCAMIYKSWCQAASSGCNDNMMLIWTKIYRVFGLRNDLVHYFFLVYGMECQTVRFW
jgi:hypothetical protein